MEKQYKVVMLAQKEKTLFNVGDILYTHEGLIISKYERKVKQLSGFKEDYLPIFCAWSQHLYIIDTKAPIEKDDYYIGEGVLYNLCTTPNGKDAAKIIASTQELSGVHKIPQSFIQSIVDNQKLPEWIELEKFWDGPDAVRKKSNAKLKLLSNGEIIIK